MSVNMSEQVTVADLKADLATLKNDLALLLSGLAENGKAQAKESIKKATASVTDFAERSQDSAKEAHEKLAVCVAERPITSLVVAVVAGALLARLCSRK